MMRCQLPRLLFGVLLLVHGWVWAKETEPDETATAPKADVATITKQFIAVDVTQNGGCEWPWFHGVNPPFRSFEYKIASGLMHYWDTNENYSWPIEHDNGTAFYFPGAVVGEAVLIKVTSQTFPSDIKTYITYNVATAGNFDGTQLRSSQPPPYYNTIPVEGKFWSASSSNLGLSGIGLYPVLCDRISTPSIGLPSMDASIIKLMAENSATWKVRSDSTSTNWLAEYPPIPDSQIAFYAIYWGVGYQPQHSREYQLGEIFPNSELKHLLAIDWGAILFHTKEISIALPPQHIVFIDLPLEGGNGAIQLLLRTMTSRLSSEIYSKPAPNLLLESAIEEYEGRAILSSHLLPLCDLNQNGKIDQADIEALRAKVLCGMITY